MRRPIWTNKRRHALYNEYHSILTKYFGENFHITSFYGEGSCEFKANDSIEGRIYRGIVRDENGKQFLGYSLRIDKRDDIGKDLDILFRTHLQESLSALEHQVLVLKKFLKK